MTVPATTQQPRYVGFYLVLSSKNLAANVRNASVIDAIKKDLAAKFGVSASEMQLTVTAESSERVSIYVGVDTQNSGVSKETLDKNFVAIKDDPALGWMKITDSTLAQMGAPLDARLLSAQTVEEHKESQQGYCEQPALCAGTIIGALVVAGVIFYALFRYQKSKLKNRAEAVQGMYPTHKADGKFTFDETAGGASLADIDPELAHELEAMQAAEDPYADEHTHAFEQARAAQKGRASVNSSRSPSVQRTSNPLSDLSPDDVETL